MIILANPDVYRFVSYLILGCIETLDDIRGLPDHQLHCLLVKHH